MKLARVRDWPADSGSINWKTSYSNSTAPLTEALPGNG